MPPSLHVYNLKKGPLGNWWRCIFNKSPLFLDHGKYRYISQHTEQFGTERSAEILTKIKYTHPDKSFCWSHHLYCLKKKNATLTWIFLWSIEVKAYHHLRLFIIKFLSSAISCFFPISITFQLIIFSPGSIDAGPSTTPPEIDIFIMLLMALVVEHGAEATHKVCIDELACALPPVRIQFSINIKYFW